MGHISNEQKARIIELSNTGTPNNKIVEALDMPLQTIFYWKRIFKKSGEIIVDLKKGRGSMYEYSVCEHCGQKVKKIVPRSGFVPTDRVAILRAQREKAQQEFDEAERFLKEKYGDEKPVPKNNNWEY